MGIYIVCQLALSIMLTAVFCLGSVVNPSVANATEYYVATTGNDGNPGTQSQPFRTINKGVSVLKPSDTLYIRQGTYTENIGYGASLPSGTSWANPITISAYSGETVTISGYVALSTGVPASYLIFDHLTVTDGQFYIGADSHHIRFQNGEVVGRADNNAVQGLGAYVEVLKSKIHDAGGYGFYMKGQNGLYDGNEVYNNAGYGFHIFSSGNNNVNNNILRNNYIHNNGGRVTNVGVTGGIILASGSNNIAYNNIICGQVNGYGIQIAYTNGGTNNQVYNNTIYSNDLAGIYIDPTAPNSIINNNIIYNNGSGIVDGGATGTVLSNNLTTDPKFVNVSANDFSLQASSPAINAGMTISVVTTDMKGVARPQGAAYDIGAYEYSQGTTPLPAPNNLRAVVQ